MVDIPRVAEARKRRIRRIIYGAIAVVAIALVTYGLSRLKPAAPTVERSTVWIEKVRRGPMLRQVRGLGTLVPEDIRWIPAVTNGRVERIIVWPGTTVEPDTVILELSNPEQAQALLEAESQLEAAEAQLTNLRVRLANELLAQQATAASVEAEFRQATLQAEADAELARQGLVSSLTTKLSQVRAEQLATRNAIEKKRLSSMDASIQAQLQVQETEVKRLRASAALARQRYESLKVRAGTPGVLQQIEVQVGQQVSPGTNLARVADPKRLKAELKIAETQAKDIQIGQPVVVDTRNGTIPGHVSRIDPAVQQGSVTVDVALDGELPKGARPDLSVDGTIELERLDDVVQVGRPTYGQDDSTIGMFKLEEGGRTAVRVKVTLGRTSVNTVEIRAGLQPGDEVILSDMSTWDAFDRVRLR
ncbi:MAG: HlyD family secretion protein [Vicinamibacterales bacterium]